MGELRQRRSVRAKDSAEVRAMLEHLGFQLDRLEARKYHARVEAGRIVLPQAARRALLRQEYPTITCWGREPCPIRPGMEYRVMGENFTIQFSEVRRNRKGHHRCDYIVRDWRPLTLQTKPTDSFARRQEKHHWTPEQEHGYSRSADTLDAGDVLDRIQVEKEADRAATEALQADELAQARRERYDLDKRLQRVIDEAERRGVDISSPKRVIERQLTKIERRIHQGKAA